VPQAALPADQILFGAAFYEEYRVAGTLERDLDLMVEAAFTVIRVGESVWSTWEPGPGQFDLEWLQPVLDGAHARGIRVILGTPTYAVPPWLRTLHPEIAAESATGRRVPWGTRQEIDYANGAFRFYAERVIRAVVGRYAAHPAVIGFQVDNEPGAFVLHNRDVFDGFLRHLRATYGTIENLNREWGLTYWSHRLTDWSELWAPDGNHSPQYQIEWRRYQALVVNEFIAWQAEIVREYSNAEQFVTTCISYERPAVHDAQLVRALDVTAGNPYYKMQEALRIGVEVPRPDIWWTSGVWGLYEQADRMFSSAQAPFLVTETNAQSIGQSHWQNHTPYPGQIALAALAFVSRGARMIEYWQWQTLHSGIETYWGGVLPHNGQPGRIYREIAELGRRIQALGPALEGYRPDADVTLLYSTDTKRSFEFYPPLATDDGGPDPQAYLRIFDAFYRGAFEAGLQSRIVHVEQFTFEDPVAFAREHPVLVVPTLYIASDAELDALVAYANAGGHLVVGIRTGYGDQLARARTETAPARIGGPAGIRYDEYSTLDAPAAVRSEVFDLTDKAAGTGWADGLELDGADVLASYASGIYRDRPAATSRAVGAGRISYVGTLPNRELVTAILSWAVPAPLATGWAREATVTLASGTVPAGRAWFVSNWSPDAASVTPPADLLDGGVVVAGGIPLVLDPWTVKVLVERTGPEDGVDNPETPEKVERS
jgi:beta-galactosidase